jgi:hypothetical protein
MCASFFALEKAIRKMAETLATSAFCPTFAAPNIKPSGFYHEFLFETTKRRCTGDRWRR